MAKRVRSSSPPPSPHDRAGQALPPLKPSDGEQPKPTGFTDKQQAAMYFARKRRRRAAGAL